MSEQQEFVLRRGRGYPSIYDLDREFDSSLREEKERERREWMARRILSSDELADRLAVKAVAASTRNNVVKICP